MELVYTNATIPDGLNNIWLVKGKVKVTIYYPGGNVSAQRRQLEDRQLPL